MLQEKRAEIKVCDGALEQLKIKQRAQDEILSGLKAEIEDCTLRKERADVLLKGLSAEK